jgi:hypothetical protein
VYRPVGGFPAAERAEILAHATTKVQWGHGRKAWGRAMSAAVVILPLIWACVPVLVEESEELPLEPVHAELAFYRKYTEAMLLRYFSMSMEAGRVPSLLGKEMFQGRVTNYVVHSFEDVVIFVHDVEKCIAKMDNEQQMLIRRIGVQQYSQGEVAGMLGVSLRTIGRRYAGCLDCLTRIFLEVKLLKPRIECQGVGSSVFYLTN